MTRFYGSLVPGPNLLEVSMTSIGSLLLWMFGVRFWGQEMFLLQFLEVQPMQCEQWFELVSALDAITPCRKVSFQGAL